MSKKIIIDANFPSETRVVLVDNSNNIENFELSIANKKQIKGNIYLAKVLHVVPSLDAAFVEYDHGKSGFLPFREIHPDYYQTLSIDKKNHELVLNELKEAKITAEDLNSQSVTASLRHLADQEDIDIKLLEKLVDEKIVSDFDIEAEEDDIEPIAPKKTQENSGYDKHHKIHEVIKKGQLLLVQITKEARGNKGASMTTYISLAGKYCVLMPNKSSNNGISRKISNADERKRLKNIISDMTMDSDNKSSVIVRTAGAGHSTLEIKKDYDYLIRLWNKIREATLNSTAPCFIHQEDGLILKTIRDTFDKNVKEVVVQGKDAYEECVKFMKDISASETKSIKEYKGKAPIFTKFGIEDQLIKLYQPIVSLPSGGYIVINPTEALISIDVNSGKSTSERTIEETALKTNLEAAREIARQAKLRDLSGLIVIDFIDLTESKNRKILERSLWEYFSKDRARIQTSAISSFGLLEMSRQRLRSSFLEMHSNMCNHCNGKGVIRCNDSNAMLILRTIENEIFNGSYDIVNIYGTQNTVLHLLNDKREEINFVEQKYSIKLNFMIDTEATSDSYSIEKIKLADKNKASPVDEIPALQNKTDIYREVTEAQSEKNSTVRQKIERSGKAKKVKVSKEPKAADEDNTDSKTQSVIDASIEPDMLEKTSAKKQNKQATSKQQNNASNANKGGKKYKASVKKQEENKDEIIPAKDVQVQAVKSQDAQAKEDRADEVEADQPGQLQEQQNTNIIDSIQVSPEHQQIVDIVKKKIVKKIKARAVKKRFKKKKGAGNDESADAKAPSIEV